MSAPSPITAVCDRTYFPAYRHSGRREENEIKWAILHDEEAPTAESAARYFKSSNAGGSAHLCVDDLKCFRCLPNDAIPWGASSAFGANTHGFHIEQAGYAKWTGTVWRAKHMRALNRAAYKTALHCYKFGIPVQFVTAAQLPHRFGITTHAEVTKASKRLDPAHAWQYTHTDPGFGWPRRLFMARVRAYYAEL
jgi:hypothetical protein